jgi:chloramphenicol 3-O-phosphotransferase
MRRLRAEWSDIAAEPVGTVWIINGIPGSGKSTVARALCAAFPRAAHIEGDRLQDLIISGSVPPGGSPHDEEARQIHLNVRNQCLLSSSFADAGIVPVIDYIVTSRARLREYYDQLAGYALHLVTLDPGVEVALERDRLRDEKTVGARWVHLRDEIVAELWGVGLWLDTSAMTPEQTIARILAERATARLA